MSAIVPEDLVQREELERQHEETVREEIKAFAAKAQLLLNGEITEDQFRPFRLKHGIYGQRQAGFQMVRCKVPSGLASARQVEQFARVADEFGGGRGHLTTRQISNTTSSPSLACLA